MRCRRTDRPARGRGHRGDRGRHVAVLLPDYDQLTLVSLPGQGLVVEQLEPIEDSAAGRAFLSDTLVEQPVQSGVRLLVPMLDGTDRVAVLAFIGNNPDEDHRRLARRFAGLLADVLITKGMYTDRVTASTTHSTTTSCTRRSSTRWVTA